MKKVLALLMACALLSSLTACGEDKKDNADTSTIATTTTTTTSNGTTTTVDAEVSTTSADVSATTTTASTRPVVKPSESPASTGSTATTTATTTVPHTHKYTSKVTKAATCTAEGVKTFSCSCGHTYTEKIAATGHKWGEWKQTVAPSYAAKGKETKTCLTCSNTETRDVAPLPLDTLFEDYVDMVFDRDFGFYFDSPNELSNISAAKVLFAIMDFVEPREVTTTEGEYGGEIICLTYAISDLDAFTLTCFNYKWDYSVLDGDTVGNMYECSYDAAKKTLTLSAPNGLGFGAGPRWIYKGYTQSGDTHFVITYDVMYPPDSSEEEPIIEKGFTVEVELIDGKYIIVAHRKA